MREECPNTGKYGSEKNTYLDTFCTVCYIPVSFYISFICSYY